MSYQAKVKKFCEEHNISIDDQTKSDRYDIGIWTPKGIRLKGLGQHSAVSYFFKTPGLTKEDAWSDLWEDLSYGLEECDDPNCETCERGLKNS